MANNDTNLNSNNNNETDLSTEDMSQQLAAANKMIEDLKLQIAWMERSYE